MAEMSDIWNGTLDDTHGPVSKQDFHYDFFFAD